MERLPGAVAEGVVAVGFAATATGEGVAYAALGRAGHDVAFVRVGFRCRSLPALLGRDVGYAALRAVVAELIRRRVRPVEIRVSDATLADDLACRRDLPAALVVPYVTLRCALNRLPGAAVVPSVERTVDDLTARARAEVSLNVAA
jgi:hypothetical protein